jgi:hypothetical protein
MQEQRFPRALTLGVYTHVELPDRSAAIESLPAPPSAATSKTDESHKLRPTGTDG